MKLKSQRVNDNGESTFGLFYIDGSFSGFTLEDEFRTQKKYGETRIPEGIYKVELRTEGGFHERYSKKFPDFHIGMLHILGIPGFKLVLIHIGNRDDDTAGCLLLGDSINNNSIGNGFTGRSTQCYKRIYPIIAKELAKGNEVTIEIKDEL